MCFYLQIHVVHMCVCTCGYNSDRVNNRMINVVQQEINIFSLHYLKDLRTISSRKLMIKIKKMIKFTLKSIERGNIAQKKYYSRTQ